jgi:hypothetical protein
MNIIEITFLDRAIVQPEGWSIYQKHDAINFVKECQKHSITILGIDGFSRIGASIQPHLNDSIDFSSRQYAHIFDVYAAALSFLEKRGEDLLFEIVCLETENDFESK